MNHINYKFKVAAVIAIAIFVAICVYSAYCDKADKADAKRELPEVSVSYMNAANTLAEERLRIGGCNWKYPSQSDEAAFVEFIENRVDRDVGASVRKIEISGKTEVSIKIRYPLKPDTICVKEFSNKELDDYSKGTIISENESNIICLPGKTYAVELQFGKDAVMYTFRCE